MKIASPAVDGGWEKSVGKRWRTIRVSKLKSKMSFYASWLLGSVHVSSGFLERVSYYPIKEKEGGWAR